MKRTTIPLTLIVTVICPQCDAFAPSWRLAHDVHARFPLTQLQVGYLDPRYEEQWANTLTSTSSTGISNNPSVQDSVAALGDGTPSMSEFESQITKLTIITFIVSMCVALPIALLPAALLHATNAISKTRCEQLSLETGQLVSKLLLRIMPFAHVEVESEPDEEPVPSIWVCNHTSMLDVFFLLAFDGKLRGKNKRPIKSVYWKGLDDNPICRLLFQMSGFIPVEMADNGSGNPNEYDARSFKCLLKESRKAFEDGFDLLVFPEGQLNPWPEEGLLEVFPGALKLAEMSGRPIRMVAIHGLHRLWHPDDNIGMTVTGRDVKMRAYPGPGRTYTRKDDDEFIATLYNVVGTFGSRGEDLPSEDLKKWLDGTAWKEEQRRITDF